MGQKMKKVRVYTTEYCPYCRAAKSLLAAERIPFEEIEATDPETRAMLIARTGRRTVPQIFFGDRPIGGYDDLLVLKQSGTLQKELSD